MLQTSEDKTWFLPGDTVIIRHNLDYKPVMVVKGKATKMVRPQEGEDKRNFLQGIICFWFTLEGEYQEKIFNSKDLIKK